MKLFAAAACLAGAAQAHTLFTTLRINGKNQGDGTCVRQPDEHKTANAPIYPLDGSNMACGRQGQNSVPFVCAADGGSTLTFEFRQWPDGTKPTSIADNHKGPCSVYMKKMGNVLEDSAAGDGWFKIWEDGYHKDTDTWCVDTLIKNNGLISVDLPTGLPPGEYLVRPELLALHLANKGDPQFYHGCAQIFIKDGPDTELQIPKENAVSIPGYLEADDPGLTYNIYQKDLPAYPIPGPPVFYPEASKSATLTSQKQKRGVIPSDCLIKNANWCATPVESFSDETGCWDGVGACYRQSDTCWKNDPPSGWANCPVWQKYCEQMDKACKNKQYEGPILFTGKEVYMSESKDAPAPYGQGKSTVVGDKKGGEGPAEKTEPATSTSSATATKPTGAKEEGPNTDDDDTPNEDMKPQNPGKQVPALKVSTDGRCGGSTGQTCTGSTFGDCCSRKGLCGRKTRHCACGCQAEFGECQD